VLNYDSRDNPFNPYKGIFLDLNAIFAAKALGGDYDYQIYQGAYNFYQNPPEYRPALLGG